MGSVNKSEGNRPSNRARSENFVKLLVDLSSGTLVKIIIVIIGNSLY